MEVENYDPYRFDDPISYAVKTGDISHGASPRDVSMSYDDNAEGPVFDSRTGLSRRANAYLGLALAMIFLIVAILGM
jgi:hypothetical protein|tara:strand:+ start:400 stop:630 length:231 start_codon:yes stop_codon:yes gene_type:complete